MTTNSFEGIHHPRIAVVRLYADEIKPRKNALDQTWMYIGIVAIPQQKHPSALRLLLTDRDDAGYHREVHFADLTNYSYAHVHNEKTLLAKKWIQRVMWNGEKTFHFYVLGLNLSNLETAAFGTGKDRKRNVYNRFFRSALSYVLKAYFGRNVLVEAIFHDKGDLNKDELFDWHSIWRISAEEPGIIFRQDTIEFIDSDHEKETRYPQESHFVQLTDVILGSARQCLDCTSSKDGCTGVAETFLPLMDRLTDRKRVRNIFSRYRYVRRCSVSFFPSRRLTLKELEDPWKRARSTFYINRRLLLKDKLSGQLRLF